MKAHGIIFVFVLLAAWPAGLCAQLDIKAQRLLPKMTATFLGGVSDGMVELLRNQYPRFQARWPNANSLYWDPRQSWKNKWQDGDPELGERFWGSSTIFAWTTDAYHLFRTIDRTTTAATVTLYLFDERRPWYVIALEGVLWWVVRTAGFHFSYTLLH